MAKTPTRTIRDLRIAAMEGDPAAMRALLRRDGFVELAREVRRDRPIPPRVKRMVDALTAGTNTEWEFVNEDGQIENDLQDDDAQLPRAEFFKE